MRYFLNALSFLTIIKIPERFYLKNSSFWKSIYFFPAVGFSIGLVLSLMFYGFNFIFHPVLIIVFLMAAEVFITGGMHLDGLADSFDGIFSGETDKKKISEIMKKSDIGAFGVLSLIFLFLIKFALLYSLLLFSEINFEGIVMALFFMPAFSRWTVNYNFYKYGYLRKQQSLASSFVSKGNNIAFLVTSIYILAAYITGSVIMYYIFRGNYIFAYEGLLSGIIFNSVADVSKINAAVFVSRMLIFLLLYYFTTAFLSGFFVKKIGNLSGDAIGAQIEIGEVTFLFYFFIIVRIF